ncbi:Thiamin biosynthesis lipoprotein ApbE [hydrothermal vent metagenome]|uniref:FAD:protein FMN transferase n=1 Tax=hydrothermal vent metagenome TaxID=652676 RepID=A0A1W1CS56_9ZZZZ
MKLFSLLLIFLYLNAEEALQTRTKVLMGTFATMSLKESNKDLFKGAFTLLNRVDNSLSSYKQNSPIYKLNRDKKATINLYTYEAFLLSQKYYIKSAGYFNIAIGSVTKDLYHFGENERVPLSWELNASDTSFDTLTFDKRKAKLGQGVKIDLGGFGKGYGVDRVVEYLKINNVKKARVALSGDIRCLGVCEININNPYSDVPLLHFFTKKEEMAISTSGNYNRFVGTEDNNHLINPKTKQSQKTFISITLISALPSSDIDAYATAASVMPKELAYKFLDSLDVAYVILESDRVLVISENITLYVNLEK